MGIISWKGCFQIVCRRLEASPHLTKLGWRVNERAGRCGAIDKYLGTSWCWRSPELYSMMFGDPGSPWGVVSGHSYLQDLCFNLYTVCPPCGFSGRIQEACGIISP